MTINIDELEVFDATECLDCDEAISIFLADAFETQDPRYIAHALGIVAKAKGMTEIAEKSGVPREVLYRSFGVNGNPTGPTHGYQEDLGTDL